MLIRWLALAVVQRPVLEIIRVVIFFQPPLEPISASSENIELIQEFRYALVSFQKISDLSPRH